MRIVRKMMTKKTETTRRKTARMRRGTMEAARRRTGNKFKDNCWEWIPLRVGTEVAMASFALPLSLSRSFKTFTRAEFIL